MCKGCIIIKRTACCYNCINFRRSSKEESIDEGLCLQFGPMGVLDDKIFSPINCVELNITQGKNDLERRINFNYCPVCGNELNLEWIED